MSKKKTVRFKISGYKDRRELIAIFADNGYKVRIDKERKGFDYDYFVEVEL